MDFSPLPDLRLAFSGSPAAPSARGIPRLREWFIRHFGLKSRSASRRSYRQASHLPKASSYSVACAPDAGGGPFDPGLAGDCSSPDRRTPVPLRRAEQTVGLRAAARADGDGESALFEPKPIGPARDGNHALFHYRLVARSLTQPKSRGATVPLLIGCFKTGRLVLPSSHFLISECPSANANPPAPL